MSKQGVGKKFDEVDSAFWFEQFIRNHPRKYFTSDEARYLHSWWREGAKWKHDSCIKLIEQLEKEKADLQQYKEMWQSIAGKENLRHLIDENRELRELTEYLQDKVSKLESIK